MLNIIRFVDFIIDFLVVIVFKSCLWNYFLYISIKNLLKKIWALGNLIPDFQGIYYKINTICSEPEKSFLIAKLWASSLCKFLKEVLMV